LPQRVSQLLGPARRVEDPPACGLVVVQRGAVHGHAPVSGWLQGVHIASAWDRTRGGPLQCTACGRHRGVPPRPPEPAATRSGRSAPPAGPPPPRLPAAGPCPPAAPAPRRRPSPPAPRR